MEIADMLNPTVAVGQLSSPPPSPRRQQSAQAMDYFLTSPASSSSASSPTVITASESAMSTTSSINSIASSISSNPTTSVLVPHTGHSNNGKPRSRFSDLEDAIICDGVRRGLTWGQISGKLPHRKRATCFNRYRTLQGIRKSRSNSNNNSIPSNDNSKTSQSFSTANGGNASQIRRKSLQGVPSNSSNNITMRSPPVTPPALTSKTAPAATSMTASHSWIPTTPPSRISDARRHHPYEHHHSCRAESQSRIREYPTLVAPLPARPPFQYDCVRRHSNGSKSSSSSNTNNGAH